MDTERKGLAHFELPLGTAVFDLGHSVSLRSAFLQASSQSVWEIAVSEDGVRWQPIWQPRPQGRGLVIESRAQLDANGRWVRLDLLQAPPAGAYAGELQIFCHEEARKVADALLRDPPPPPPGWREVGRRAIESPRAVPLGLALVAVFVGLAAPRRWLARTPDSNAYGWALATAGLVLANALVMTLSLPQVGYNIDESYQTQHGIELADWYGTLLSQWSWQPFQSSTPAMDYYGGFFELCAELAARVSPMERVETRRLVTVLFGSLALVGTYLLGRFFGGRATGFAATLFLLVTPRFQGHVINNPKDIPFAALHVFALLAICLALPRLPALPLRWILAVGASLGGVIAIRVGGVVVLSYFAIACAAWWLLDLLRGQGFLGWRLARLAASFAAVIAVAWTVMVAFWPWAWSSPLVGPLEALAYFRDVAHHGRVSFSVFFEGRQILLTEIPRHFTARWLLLAAPEFWLLAPLGLVAWARRVPPPDGTGGRWRGLGGLLVALSVGLPLGLTLTGNVSQFGAIRHFAFLFPLLSVGLAAAVTAGLRALPTPGTRAAIVAALAGSVGLTLWDAARLHPYEYVYFNRSFAGGLREASRSYQTDYLGLSYREGANWLLEHYPPGDRDPLRVASCPGFLTNLLRPLREAPDGAARFKIVPLSGQPDVAVTFTRGDCHRRFRGRVVATVRRDGTPLLYVTETRKGASP
jgi:hypothetical protein